MFYVIFMGFYLYLNLNYRSIVFGFINNKCFYCNCSAHVQQHRRWMHSFANHSEENWAGITWPQHEISAANNGESKS